MYERIKPLAFWTPDELPPSLVDRVLSGHYVSQYDLPTEQVLVGNRQPFKQAGRYWMHAFGEVNNWEHLIEVYADQGEDGHIEHGLIGYARINDAQLKQFTDAVEKCMTPWEYPQFEVEENSYCIPTPKEELKG